MRRPAPLHLALLAVVAVSLLAITSCGEDPPTQPGSSDDPFIPGPSLSTASNTWTQKASSLGEEFFGGYSIGTAPNPKGESIVYAIGGSSSDNGNTGFPIQAYNTVTNTWKYTSSAGDNFNMNGVGKIGTAMA